MSKKLGVTDGRLADMPRSPNAVSSQTTVKSKRVEPLAMTGDVTATKQKVVQCLEKMSNNAIASETDNYIHCIFTTPLLRFKDDVEFYIDNEDRLVHFRSASRLGHSDFGANRKRYDAFAALYSRS